MAEWQQNVQDLKDFIDARCVAITTGLIDCYSLSGPYSLTVDVDPPLSGDVKINSTTPSSYSYTGTYYGGIDILLKANPATGFVFSYWEVMTDTVLPDSLLSNVTLTIDASDTVIAHFIPQSQVQNFGVTLYVQPAGSGTIDYNSTTISSFPYTDSASAGDTIILSAISSDTSCVFDHWELNNNTLSPSTLNSTVSFIVSADDTITAVFTCSTVDMNNITYSVQPTGSGTLNINGTNVSTFPYSDSVITGASVTLVATPYNALCIFDRWESQIHTFIPSAFDSVVSFTVVGPDDIVAIFTCTLLPDTSPPVDNSITFYDGFSPNGDGFNDKFIIDNVSNYPDNSFVVYNRWGNIVFEGYPYRND